MGPRNGPRLEMHYVFTNSCLGFSITKKTPMGQSRSRNQSRSASPPHRGRLVTEAVWLRRHRGRLVTEAVWLQRPSGYGGRPVTEAVWSQRPSGHRGRPVTEAVWLQRPSGYRGRPVTDGYICMIYMICIHTGMCKHHIQRPNFF
jgi:hypothetical protein